MSSQDLLLGNSYLVQCQQLALQALACAAAANSNNHQTPTASSSASHLPQASNTSSAARQRQLEQEMQLRLEQEMKQQLEQEIQQQIEQEMQQQLEQEMQQQQQLLQQQTGTIGQVQWNIYLQAIAAALMSGANTTSTPSNNKNVTTPYSIKSNSNSVPIPTINHSNKASSNGFRFNPMRGHHQTQPSAASKLKSTCSNMSMTESPLPIALTTYKTQPPTVPSSTLLAKLGYVTSRPNTHETATKLDQKMIDLLEAFYAINDNPEQAATEMIAKRTNVAVEAISEWFDQKRLKTNPNAGPRSPPAKKREGGRVVTFSEYQRSLLEAIFDENNYLHPQEYEELSNLIQVPSRNIKIWFKNRRSKQRLSGRINTPGSANNSD